MINNRQGGRRRGRGGQRPNVGGQSGGGNRQDNRQRGNAAQLLEKYKSMARDSQLAGDRVQTEYYLQYAEHYFRVLGESRARFDEQRRQRGDDGYDDDNEDDLEAGDDTQADGDDDGGFDRGNRRERGDRDHGDRHRPNVRDDRGDDERPQQAERPERAERADRPDRGDRNRRPARDDRPARDERDEDSRVARGAPARSNGDSIPFDALPPAIGAAGDGDADQQESERPRRRTRRPRPPETEGDIAPAA